MDNYPKHLAPEFEDGGAVATPFEEWWLKAKDHFSRVPEEVARTWLHEHWSHSPFSWIPSKDYQFELIDWKPDELRQIRSGWCNFSLDNEGCLAHGLHLIRQFPIGWRYKTADFMREHGCFPVPIIVLDNRDGHLVSGQPPVPAYTGIPAAFVLVEGHRRFNMGLYLASIGQMRSPCKVWLLTRVSRS